MPAEVAHLNADERPVRVVLRALAAQPTQAPDLVSQGILELGGSVGAHGLSRTTRTVRTEVPLARKLSSGSASIHPC